MFRLFWIVFAAAFAAAAAFFLTPVLLKFLIPLLASNAAQRDWMMIIEETSMARATMAALAVFLFTFSGAGLFAFLDFRRLSNCQGAIAYPRRGGPQIKTLLANIEGDDAFFDSATAYSASFKDVADTDEENKAKTRTTADATGYFASSQLSRDTIKPAFFQFTILILFISGIVLFLNEWASPSAPSLMTAIMHGTIAFSITTATALFCLSSLNALLGWRRSAYDRFCRVLNRQFQVDRYDLMETSINDIKTTITGIGKQAEALQSEKTAQVDKVISTALESFLDELRKIQSKELSGVEQRLKAVAEAAQALDRAYTDNLKQTSKTIATTLKDLKTTQTQSYSSLVKSQEKAANALKSSIEKNQKVVETAISSASKSLEKAAIAQAEVAIKGLNPTISELEKISGGMNAVLERMATGLEYLSIQQAEISQSFSSEGTAAKVIENAATDMIAASKASRETVERFIALAERMRTITTTLKNVKGSNGKTSESRETAKKLSAALKDLSAHVEGGDDKEA